MTNEELIAKIKEWIERRIDAFANVCMNEREKGDNESCAYYQGKIASCEHILSFLSTFEKSEKPMNQEGLEKEINRYFNAWQNVQCDEDCSNEGGFCCVLNDELKPVSLFHCRKIARHFAQWGAEHTPLPEDTVLFNKGVAEGRRLAEEEQADLFTIVALDAAQRAKEQMMKEAVDVEVESFSDMHPEISIPLNPTMFKAGDKIRVIVCKNED